MKLIFESYVEDSSFCYVSKFLICAENETVIIAVFNQWSDQQFMGNYLEVHPGAPYVSLPTL